VTMPKKLLLAEDSLTIRKVFELALSRSDIAVTSVDNGEDAVRLASEILPDLVVADLTLPGKNGFAVAAELRAMEKTEKIPVLILSGTLVPLDEARFKASGARGVLFKPFESRELLENIERILRESTPAPESRPPQEAPAVDERWDFSDVMDDDGLAARNIPIVLTIHKTGDRMIFDFKGSSRQVPGNINMTLNGTVAAVSFALKSLLDPEIPNNEGVLRVVDVRAEKGLIVNAEFPAATAARLHTCQRVADVVFGALACALPERVVAGGNGANTTAIFSGVDPRSGEPYVYLETLGGGAGGRVARDGKDGVQVNLTNTSNLPVEAIELEYPLMVEGYGLVPDTGGAGRQRGGLALCRIIRPVGHTCIFNGAGERFTNRPWGLFGGEPGASGSFKLIRQDGSSERLSNKPSSLSVGPDETVVVQTPGAGGYGPANERSISELQGDLESEKYSVRFIMEHYPDFAKQRLK